MEKRLAIEALSLLFVCTRSVLNDSNNNVEDFTQGEFYKSTHSDGILEIFDNEDNKYIINDESGYTWFKDHFEMHYFKGTMNIGEFTK